MRGKPGSCGARGVQPASRRAKEAAGSQSPARVPCVQRQKMVSERPGLLLVPHTSSISSLVSSDMMGYRRAGLRFQDSCPGTWGRGACGDRRCGTAAAKELEGWTRGRRKETELLAETAPVKPARAAARSFPYRKCRATSGSPFATAPHAGRTRVSPPRKRKWGAGRASVICAVGQPSGAPPGPSVRCWFLNRQGGSVPWALACFYHPETLPSARCSGLSCRL